MSYAISSELVANTSTSPEVVISFPVIVENTPWLRLSFSEVLLSGDPDLGTGSLLRLTSLRDGGVQELNAVHVQQWQNSSAYFNGDAVLVEVLAQPGTGLNRVVVDSVTAGEIPSEDSQCGPADDRVLSNDPRSARLLPIGCTGWIIDDCASCFLTAGHCTGGTQIVEFSVPLSTSNGTKVNASPDDQYAVDNSSMQSNGGLGVGNDWGYFGVFPNPNTGLTPFQAQGARHTISVPPPFNPSQNIRITGYGVDFSPPQNNQVQQTHVGPWVTSSGSTVQYVTDTEGGNSGSPVLHEESGNAIGIHTHGGCSTSGFGQNSGTSLTHTGLQAALANPQGVCAAAVCGSVGQNYCDSNGAVISGNGSESIAANNLTLRADGLPSGMFGLFIYSGTKANTPFGQGTKCIGPSSIFRITPAATSNHSGVLMRAVDYGNLSAAGAIHAGSTWNFQALFRVPGGFDLTDGLEITFVP